MDGLQPDLRGAAPQGGTNAQLGGESCGHPASIANGLQHEQELKQDDGGALRLVGAPSPPAQSTARLLDRDPLKGPRPGCGLSSPDQRLRAPGRCSWHPRHLPGSSRGSQCQAVAHRARPETHTGCAPEPRCPGRHWSWPPGSAAEARDRNRPRPQPRSLVRGLSQASPWDVS